MMPTPVARLALWPLEIPMRSRFRHAAGERAVAQPLVVQAELSDGVSGFGETHPRPYVSGETTESAIAAIRKTLLPFVVEMRPALFAEALEAIDAMPLVNDAGRTITAARAAVELALLDAYARSFGRSFDEIPGWLGVAGLGHPGSLETVRYSGVIGGSPPSRAAWSVRKMRCYGLRDFKLKVGDPDDDARLRAVLAALGGSLRRGAATLRLDANGGWTLDEARARLKSWAELPIACLEQPLPRGYEASWYQLLTGQPIPLMADESLVLPDDARALIQHRAAAWFNIRISKNGGLIPALRLAALAHRHGLTCQLGCMVGETSVLSAAGRWFLSFVPRVRFAEGSFGSFLLRGDVTRRPIRFGFRGRFAPPVGPGLGVTVDTALLERWCPNGPIRIAL